MSDWLELELAHQLRPVQAPDELWSRLQGGAARGAGSRTARFSTWALAAVLAGIAAACTLWLAARGRALTIDVQQLALEQLRSTEPLDLTSADPREISRWIRQQAGIDVKLPAGAARLIGARLIRRGGQRIGAVSYRVGGDSATLLVAHADACRVASRHGQGLAAWRSQDQVYALACSNPGRPRAACLLCHTSL